MASFDAGSSNIRETAREDDMQLVSHDTTARYVMRWPVEVIMPIYTRGPHPVTHRAFRFRYTSGTNTLIPLDGPLSMEHIHFLLDCFVVTYGQQRVHLGRYHPQSNPEQFTSQNQLSDTDILNNDPSYFAQFRAERSAQRNIMRLRTALEVPDPHDPTEFRGYYLDLPIRVNRRTSNSPSEPVPNRNRSSNARTINELKFILERLLDTDELMEWEQARCLADVLEMLPEGTRPPIPHFPVGNLELEECGICCIVQFSYRRPCCGFSACTSCLKRYYASRVEIGQVKINCCNSDCNMYVHRDEISARLDTPFKEQFNTLVLLANQDENTKTCPRCNHLTEFDKVRKLPRDPNHPNYPRVACPSCQLEWCFSCHAPAHGVLTCKQYKKGDRLLRNWARARTHGQLNAQKCPNCKVYIERTSGCDHMHCPVCNTDFCYKCGEKFRHLKFFGDHFSKLSIFGCKYRFKTDQPFQRRAIRGAVFGGKVIAAPFLGTLAICAGALAVGISLFVWPIYGGILLHKHCESRKTTKAFRRQPPPTYPNPRNVLYLP